MCRPNHLFRHINPNQGRLDEYGIWKSTSNAYKPSDKDSVVIAGRKSFGLSVFLCERNETSHAVPPRNSFHEYTHILKLAARETYFFCLAPVSGKATGVVGAVEVHSATHNIHLRLDVVSQPIPLVDGHCIIVFPPDFTTSGPRRKLALALKETAAEAYVPHKNMGVPCP